MRRTIGAERGHFLRAEVQGARRLTPHLIRVTFGGGELPAFDGCAHGDERIRIAFPAVDHGEPPVPTYADGAWGYHDPGDREQVRSYTVRRWDPGAVRMEVDFVVHDGGVASRWAQHARPGDAVTMTLSDGWHRAPDGPHWQLLVADMTGLPALERIVETLPAHVEAHVIVETVDEDDVRRLPGSAVASQRWLAGAGHGRTPSALPDAVRAFTPPPGVPGYVWFGGESAASREVRRHARTAWGLGPEGFDIIGYWTAGKEQRRDRAAPVAAELAAMRAELVARGVSGSELLTLYDEELERRGL